MPYFFSSANNSESYRTKEYYRGGRGRYKEHSTAEHEGNEPEEEFAETEKVTKKHSWKKNRRAKNDEVKTEETSDPPLVQEE